MLVCEKWRIPREAVIQAVKARSSVDLHAVSRAEEIEIAILLLEEFRRNGPDLFAIVEQHTAPTTQTGLYEETIHGLQSDEKGRTRQEPRPPNAL